MTDIFKRLVVEENCCEKVFVSNIHLHLVMLKDSMFS